MIIYHVKHDNNVNLGKIVDNQSSAKIQFKYFPINV